MKQRQLLPTCQKWWGGALLPFVGVIVGGAVCDHRTMIVIMIVPVAALAPRTPSIVILFAVVRLQFSWHAASQYDEGSARFSSAPPLCPLGAAAEAGCWKPGQRSGACAFTVAGWTCAHATRPPISATELSGRGFHAPRRGFQRDVLQLYANALPAATSGIF